MSNFAFKFLTAATLLASAAGVQAQISPGTYKGSAEKGYGCLFSVCAMRVVVDATAYVFDDGTMSVDVRGSGRLPKEVHVKCPKEPYRLLDTPLHASQATLSAATIILLNYPMTAASTSNCIDSALPSGVTLKTLTYDAGQKQIHMNIAPVGINVQLKLQAGADAGLQSAGGGRGEQVGILTQMRSRNLRGNSTLFAEEKEEVGVLMAM